MSICNRRLSEVCPTNDTTLYGPGTAVGVAAVQIAKACKR
jgi:hypothetical protein